MPYIDYPARGRPADQLRVWAAQRAPALNIPATALEAYAYAARVAHVENPDCQLAWTTPPRMGTLSRPPSLEMAPSLAPPVVSML